MKTERGLAPILIVLLIALGIGGYLVYQKQTKPTSSRNTQPISTPLPKGLAESEKKLKIQKTAHLEQTTSWKIYKDNKYGIQVKYPPNWVVENKFSRTFENGDVVTFLDNTYPQQANSEYYNTAIFTVGTPIKTVLNVTSWVKDYYSNQDSRREISEETINSVNYRKVFICGLGCFNYYHTKIGDFLYSFSLTYSGPDKVLPDYEQKLINMLYTVKITQ